MLGLALEGGGAKGAFHIGAVRALIEANYRFDGVTGTSIGALNGAMIAQGDFDVLEDWWQKIDASELFDIDQMKLNNLLNRQIDRQTMRYLIKKTRDIMSNRGIDTQRIRKILHQFVDEDRLRATKMDFGLVTVAVSLSNLKPLELYKEDIPKGQVVDYLMASANLPVFKIEPLDGKYFLDGGLYDNCPINLLTSKGYDEVIAIRTLSLGITKPPVDKRVKITSIVPSENIGNVLNFDHKQIMTNINMGYCDAKRVLEGLAGTKYYLTATKTDAYYFDALQHLPDEAIDAIAKRLWLPKMERTRMLFEHILPTTAGYLGLSKTATYKDIVINVLEFMANKAEIDRYEIKRLNAFVREIKKSKICEYYKPLTDKGVVLKHLSNALIDSL